MIMNFGIGEIVVILAVAYFILGPKKFPQLGKKAGAAVREISKETKELRDEIDDIKASITEIDSKNGGKA